MSAARDDGPSLGRGKDRYETERDAAMIFMGACTIKAGSFVRHDARLSNDEAIKAASDIYAKAKTAAAFV